ncbi:hypothetical protein KP509_01G110300 [Ceratopteris richardii]|nr:hypothetical protein KP509_01G110300 [Ceratopteris richardii]
MEFPHNAVLLCCSSHEKGCRPYMCNTSYRHSNCLDQYHKAQQGVLKNHLSRESLPEIVHEAGRPYNGTRRTSHGSDSAVHYTAVNVAQENLGTEVAVSNSDLEVDAIEQFDPSSSCSRSDMMGLLCPLCRGKVKGWIVVQAARDHLNHKVRSCAQEACLFAGTYEELRLHARREHPFARPFEVDPDRQRNWSRLQRRRDLADVMSTVMPSATMLGDVMVDDDLEEDEFIDFPGDDGHFWTAFLLFQVFGPATSVMSESVHVRSRPSVPHRGLRRGQPVSNDTMQSDTVSDNNSPELSRSSRRHSRRAEG